MYKITKLFELSFSHQLEGLPEGHPCGRVHGHNAVVLVELSMGTVDQTGFVMDYGKMYPMKEWLDATFDHRHMNDCVDFNPTAENMAKYIYEWCVQQDWPVTKVGWSETPKTWAYYSEPAHDPFTTLYA